MVLAAAFPVVVRMQPGRNVKSSRIAVVLVPVLILFPDRLAQQEPLALPAQQEPLDRLGPKEFLVLPAPLGRPEPLDRLDPARDLLDPPDRLAQPG